jgi:hypothetical protein
MEDKITASVGEDGKNNDADVRIIQALLIKAGSLAALNKSGKSNVDGICGSNTINAIMRFQNEKMGVVYPDGLVEPGKNTWKALTGKKQEPTPPDTSTPLPADDGKVPVNQRPAWNSTTDLFTQIKQNYPNGVTVAIYAKYDNQNANNREFPRASDEYAKNYNCIGMDAAGKLKVGIAHPVKSLAEVTNIVNGIHNLLKKEFLKTGVEAAVLPAYTKVKVLALLCHGMPWGLNLSGSHTYNLRIDKAGEPEKAKAFVKSIAGALKNDVTVALFACNAGREADGTEAEKGGVWMLDQADEQDGSSSFAAFLAREIGNQATVYGHLSAGHTINNFSARAFGKEAGKDATVTKAGIHIFYLLYPASFVTAEATRLKKTAAQVKAKMWKHFTSYMKTSHETKFFITNAQGSKERMQLGAEMFTDVFRAKAILQADWPKWVAKHPI